jgi:putative ATP-dependent endonuclease of OLD family
MKVRSLEIENFRSIKHGRVIFSDHTLLVGGNNVGKSTICEALDLALGPERLYRRPVVDEHDFYGGRYIDDDNRPIEIRIRAVLVDLSQEAIRRFGNHCRRWDETNLNFIDETPGGADIADQTDKDWALPVLFVARYDRDEDDFVGQTFFEHPTIPDEDIDDEQRTSLGQGRSVFRRLSKRLCGYIYLRALRTGSRALSLQRGSLLDTILNLGDEGNAAPEMWFDTLAKLRDLDPAVGEIAQLKAIRTEIHDRLGKFVSLPPGDASTAFFASDLTREHLREVVRLFVATSPSDHLVPFTRQGAGTLNLLVFSLLTFIADQKGNASVIFAMEEPEIALPPHIQRRVTRFVRATMGQAIVTSHSPYVIEQFDPEDIVMLNRHGAGKLVGFRPQSVKFRPTAYRSQRRQFAEAILARGVVVVEGSTEAALLPAASSILEQSKRDYTHLDLAGISVFTANGDGDVPRWGPIFKAFHKQVFGFRDKQPAESDTHPPQQPDGFDMFWESPESGIEQLLVKQTKPAVHRRFLDSIASRSDYPSRLGKYNATMTDREVADLATKVLKARKGEGFSYGALFIECCHHSDELPEFLKTILLYIDKALRPIPNLTDTGDGQSDDATESIDSRSGEASTPEVDED